MNLLGQLFAVLFTFPFIPGLLIWLWVWYKTKDQKLAWNWAVAGTVPFLIVIVAAMYDETIGTEFKGLYIIILFLLLLAGLIGNLQYRIKGEINRQKLLKAVWRIAFTVLAPSYVLLLIVGIAKEFTS